jgi:hypothetical protein
MRHDDSSGKAGTALALLLLINLFNYIDRYLLAAVMPQIEKAFFSSPERTESIVLQFVTKFDRLFGFTPRLAAEPQGPGAVQPDQCD